MHITRTISTVEAHAGGEPFRIVTSGLPRLPGASIVQRRAWLRNHADEIRQALMFEPRGHADMYGGYLTPPVSPDADFGIIFLHNEGYSDHCGHGVIALATAAVELGWVQRAIPETRVGLDAPCGFIEAHVEWDGSHAGGVRFINVPSFIYRRDVSVQTPTFGTVSGDIAYGGAFYFYVDGRPHGLSIRESSIEALKRFGAEVKEAANRAFPVAHPDIPEINHIYGTIIDGDPRHSGSTQANCCVFADREVDRSPTGSGTAGRAAQLYLRGRLRREDTLVNESVIGTTFSAKVIRETLVADMPAVIPEVSGTAHIHGFATWVLDERDPLRHGFLVR
ncbi:proline racemase family protein [Achromobacter sp. Marseille-Q0513]|uniref:trans-3-hydroxy-L-proline dehydratase n=1 Tax=Achromobacter sp. Marseille-Q0513 TaxID=2829161 RepID=UPI001B9F0EAF|nr:trans-3-hydroxy-L-proline dehydratase [Achromobacter sp. Marseille-Q0513]MBR8655458.1 proline racemase family protein [Achromobacter sp. Marseille-Q0513]